MPQDLENAKVLEPANQAIQQEIDSVNELINRQNSEQPRPKGKRYVIEETEGGDEPAAVKPPSASTSKTTTSQPTPPIVQASQAPASSLASKVPPKVAEKQSSQKSTALSERPVKFELVQDDESVEELASSTTTRLDLPDRPPPSMIGEAPTPGQKNSIVADGTCISISLHAVCWALLLSFQFWPMMQGEKRCTRRCRMAARWSKNSTSTQTSCLVRNQCPSQIAG